MSKSSRPTRARTPVRPPKPYPEFPLTPHPAGAWVKKINGRVFYFGKWGRVVDGKLTRVEGDGWKDALAEYEAHVDAIHRTGEKRDTPADRLTIAALCNHFLTAKTRQVEAGELGPRMFAEYKETTDLIVGSFGKGTAVEELTPADFGRLRATMARRWGPVRLSNAVTRVKTVFKFGTDNGLVERAVRYGTEFKKPDRSVLRRHRAKAGPKMLEADQLRRLLDALEGKEVTTGQYDPAGQPVTVRLEPDPQLRAMVLLGLNAAFGNTDVATLPLSAVELDRAMVVFPRPKTGIARRAPLWPQTVAALKTVIDTRPSPAGYAECGIVFLNSRGTQWVRSTPSFRSDSLSRIFREALAALGMHRTGVSFYTLRHVHRTIADGARDPVACDVIMGHSDPTMGGHYRERVDDDRLKAVTDHVRRWLFEEVPGAGSAPPSAG